VVVLVASTPAQREPRPDDDFVSTDELARRQGITPISSLNDLVGEDPFASDEEYAAFLADLYESRRSGIS
jgi:hypothetical protein